MASSFFIVPATASTVVCDLFKKLKIRDLVLLNFYYMKKNVTK
jgi:hypothetical protein